MMYMLIVSVGRILTKFGESKLFALTEVGIHNLLTLFLILASIIGTDGLVNDFEFKPDQTKITNFLQL